jgi:hypothetical protein
MEIGSTAIAESPADAAIRLLGAKRIAHACDVTTDAVRKWTKRGSGLIPARYQGAVFGLARELGVELSPSTLMGLAA